MNYLALLAGQSIAIENALELTDNFVIENFPSPNPTKTAIENIKCWKTNDEYDGYNVYEQQIAINGINNPIPFEVIDLDANEKIYNGFALPYAEGALLKRDGDGNSIVLPLSEEEQDFDKICESVHLRGFMPAPYTYTPWNSSTYYSNVNPNVVSYKGSLYKAVLSHSGVAPDSVAGQNNWLLVGGVPYPGAFSYSDYEIQYCVVEQPDSPLDAAYWISFILSLVSLAIVVIDLIQDGIRLFSADISGAQATAAIVGLTLKGITLLFLIYQLIEGFVIPVRKYYRIKVKKILQKAFEYLGYTLKSSILNSPEFENLVYISKTHEQAVITGNPTNIPIPDMNLLDFMTIWANKFNAKFKPMGNINNNSKQIYFENISFFWQAVNPSTGRSNGFIIPKLKNDGTIQQCNYEELHENYSLSFADDASDMGNHKASKSHAVTAMFAEQNTTHKSVKALQGTLDIRLPVSLAAAKGGDSVFQKLFNTIYDALSFLIGNIDKGGDRRGMLLIPNNNIGVDKVFISDGGNLISSKNSETLSAANLYTRFHKSRTIKGGFQFKRVSQKGSFVQQARFAKELFYWNVCKDEEGRTCIVTKFTQNLQSKLIEIEYRYQEDFSDRSKITESISIG